jgi:hypothetical protein
MCLRRAPEKYIAGAALDRDDVEICSRDARAERRSRLYVDFFYDIQVYFAICSDTFRRMEC